MEFFSLYVFLRPGNEHIGHQYSHAIKIYFACDCHSWSDLNDEEAECIFCHIPVNLIDKLLP